MKFFKGMVLGSLMTISVLLFIQARREAVPPPIPQKQQTYTLSYKLQREENIKLLASLLKQYNIFHRDITIAQVLIETGYFRSQLFREGNNMFGMKIAGTRPISVSGHIRIGSVVYARYKNYKDCVLDFALWQASIMNYERKVNKDKYLQFLSRRYSKNKRYVALIQDVIRANKLKQY